MWLIPTLHDAGWEYSNWRAEEEFHKDVMIEGVKHRLVADVQYFDEGFFGVYLYNYLEGQDDIEIDPETMIHLITAEMLDGEENDPYRLKLIFHPEIFELFSEEEIEDIRLVYAEAFELNMPDIEPGKIIEIENGWKIPVVQQYKALFTAYMTVEGKDEDDAKDVAWDIFRDGGWSTSWLEVKQEDPGTEDWRTPILNDSQIDILLGVLDDHRYAVIDALKDENLGMDEEFETRKYIDEIDKLVKRLKEARA